MHNIATSTNEDHSVWRVRVLESTAMDSGIRIKESKILNIACNGKIKYNSNGKVTLFNIFLKWWFKILQMKGKMHFRFKPREFKIKKKKAALEKLLKIIFLRISYENTIVSCMEHHYDM